jgi:hypothetical protein
LNFPFLYKKNTVGDESKGAPAKWPSSAEDLTKYGYKRYKESLHFQHFRFISLFGENLPVLKKYPTGT